RQCRRPGCAIRKAAHGVGRGCRAQLTAAAAPADFALGGGWRCAARDNSLELMLQMSICGVRKSRTAGIRPAAVNYAEYENKVCEQIVNPPRARPRSMADRRAGIIRPFAFRREGADRGRDARATPRGESA